MTTPKMKPMSEEEIRELICGLKLKYDDCESEAGDGWKIYHCNYHSSESIRRLILAWIHERAAVERFAWRPMSYQKYFYQIGVRKINTHFEWINADWVAAVKERIEWKD
jgi:hypothetical protein